MIPALVKSAKPSDCALAFGLPLTEAEFRRDLQSDSGKDWVKHFSAVVGNLLPDSVWADHYVPMVVEPTLELMRIAKMMSVSVYQACSLADFSAAAQRHPVLTLVSHWLKKGAIELSDGVYPAEIVAATLPPRYDKVLDLTICQSILLANEVKKRCPNSVCVCNAKETRLRRKLFLYGQTLITLQESDISYPDAVLKTYGKERDGIEKH